MACNVAVCILYGSVCGGQVIQEVELWQVQEVPTVYVVLVSDSAKRSNADKHPSRFR